MPDTDTASPVDTQLLTHRAVRSAGWRHILPVHPAAELSPHMTENELRVLGDDIKARGLQVPITVMCERDGETGEWSYLLLDGRNRLDAIERAGFNTIAPNKSRGRAERRREGRECGLELFLGLPHELCFLDKALINYIHPPDDPYAYVASANVHRLHLTAEQKRELITKLLKATPEKSNRQIAETARTSDKTVAKVRAEKEATAEIPQLTKTVGKDGKARKLPDPKTANKDEAQAKRREAEAKAALVAQKDVTHPLISGSEVTQGQIVNEFKTSFANVLKMVRHDRRRGVIRDLRQALDEVEALVEAWDKEDGA
jgi:hypothetical protein